MAALTYAGILSQGYADVRRLLIDPNQAMSSVTAGNPWPYDPYFAGQTINPQFWPVFSVGFRAPRAIFSGLGRDGRWRFFFRG